MSILSAAIYVLGGSWWLNLSQDISKMALCESSLLKFATMSGKLPSGKLKTTILSWKNIFKHAFLEHPQTKNIKKHQTTKRCDLPTTYEIDSMLRKTIPTNERVKLFWTHFIPSLVLFHVSRGNCIRRRLCAIWTPAMRELERGKLLSIWSLTIIATHSKWNVQTTCAHM